MKAHSGEVELELRPDIGPFAALASWHVDHNHCGPFPTLLTPAQMRRLAAMLLRAADRIDKLSEKCIGGALVWKLYRRRLQ